MRTLIPRSVWLAAAVFGAFAVAQTVAQESSPRTGMPPLPPLPGAGGPSFNGPQPSNGTPATPVPVRPQPSQPAPSSQPSPSYQPTPRYGQPSPSVSPATPNYSPAAPTQTAPPPAAAPDNHYGDATPAPTYSSPAPAYSSPAPTYHAPAPYVGSTQRIAPPRYHAGYQPDYGVDPALYYNEGAGYGGSYPNPIGAPYYWGYGASMGGHVRYPYYSYRRPWYNPGPAVYVHDTNIHW